MKTFVKLFSNKENEIYRFLKLFYNLDKDTSSETIPLLEWEESYENPIEMANIIGVFIDNIDDFEINMWICLDQDILINVTKHNVDDLIKYLYERFPY